MDIPDREIRPELRWIFKIHYSHNCICSKKNAGYGSIQTMVILRLIIFLVCQALSFLAHLISCAAFFLLALKF